MTVTLVPMTLEQYDEYLVEAVRGYARSFVDAGILTQEAADDRSRRDFERLLPDGLDTVGEHLYAATDPHRDGGRTVGMLWLHLPVPGTEPDEFGPPPDAGYVYDVSVHEAERRRGYGRAIMEAGITRCREAGLASLRLNVFGHNEPAKTLYERLGFQVTSTQMKLDLHDSSG